jgi:pyrimidine operon attenuation protein/uracil phosphoribosyltransferase
MIKKELLVQKEDEFRLLERLAKELLEEGFNAENTIVVTVSTDYSSVVGQYIRHQLSHRGEICTGFGIDVPYPDEEFDKKVEQDIVSMFAMNYSDLKDKKILLVEAGIIRGGNYTKIVDLLEKTFQVRNRIVTLAMYENIYSIFKSDFVGEYYDNNTQDLTFWWETYNKHWN